ncbi:MAG: carbohydrate ABC transporter substrate-binding protein, partial [Actinomycetia bacterium]|nr:carbohydrate ABC transporter substrate-binding protein [Actinomycetes bacterium]
HVSTDDTSEADDTDDTDTTEADDTDTTEADDTEDVDLAGTEGTITGSERSEEEAGAFQDALDLFSAETGIEITFTGSANWEAEINVAVEAGTVPDISMFPQPGKLADFARDGAVLPLPAETTAAVAANWGQSWLDFGNVDGEQYGVPAKSDLKSLVWYQPSAFEELGYNVPETWDQLKNLTEVAAADGNTPWCVGIESGQATGWPFTDWVEDLMLRFHGADVYDQWVLGEVPFSDERVIQVFNEINDLWSIDGAVFASGGSIAATAFGDNGQGLVDGDCLMHRQASFFSAFIPEGTAFADGTDGAVDVFYFPPVDDTRPVLGAGLLAGAFDDRPEVWAVMEYLGSPEYANARQAAQAERKGGPGSLSGFLSAVNGADPSLYAPLEQSMLDVLADGEVVRFDGSDLMPADVGAGTFWTEGTSFVNGDKDAAAAAEAIDASWP